MPRLFLSKREMARAWQVMKVAGRFGLLPLVKASGLGRVLGVRLWRRMERRYQTVTPPERLRLAITELGTTFIKLGQVLSARSDLLPPAYLTELAKLQDNVPPLAFEEIEPVFRASFHFAPSEVFRNFDPTPIASASIGQVYRAQLTDGTPVVVKIQRPGLLAQVDTDISLMMRVANLAHKTSWLQRFDLPSLVREFRFILQDELIYTLEAHNMETLAREMSNRPDIALPTVYWQLTSRQVLTSSFVAGVKITDFATLAEQGIDRQKLAVNLANSILEQILLHGLFHGDPHPGNMLITKDGTIVFLDTGIVGRLDRKTRELLIELAVAIFDQDIDAILAHLQELGVVIEMTDLPPLRRDLSRLITKYYFLPRKELRLGELLQRINNLLFEHHIRMAYEFGLMAKALFVVEGIAQELDPNFDYNQAARPVIDMIRRSYYSPQSFIDDAFREMRSLRRQIVDLPSRLNAVLNVLERGTLKVEAKEISAEARNEANSILLNRLSLMLLCIGVLITSSLILTSHAQAWLHLLAIVALPFDGALLAWLLISIFRSGRI